MSCSFYSLSFDSYSPWSEQTSYTICRTCHGVLSCQKHTVKRIQPSGRVDVLHPLRTWAEMNISHFKLFFVTYFVVTIEICLNKCIYIYIFKCCSTLTNLIVEIILYLFIYDNSLMLLHFLKYLKHQWT